jgi:hypothetical protein
MEILSVCLLLLADFCLSGRHPAQSGRCSVIRMQTMWGVRYCKRSLRGGCDTAKDRCQIAEPKRFHPPNRLMRTTASHVPKNEDDEHEIKDHLVNKHRDGSPGRD